MPPPYRRRRLPVEQAYPRVARWVQGYGWIDALEALDAALATRLRDHFGE